MAHGTARMASLCLPGASLHVGVDWARHAPVMRALADPARPAILLYPGPGARDILREPPTGPVTLVVVDGTWPQARRVVRDNPALAALPRYAFTSPEPSRYRIRREPDGAYCSTIEALMHVLGVLEGDPARFRALLPPFEAMIDAQLACEASGPAPRPRVMRPARAPSPEPAGGDRAALGRSGVRGRRAQCVAAPRRRGGPAARAGALARVPARRGRAVRRDRRAGRRAVAEHRVSQRAVAGAARGGHDPRRAGRRVRGVRAADRSAVRVGAARAGAVRRARRRCPRRSISRPSPGATAARRSAASRRSPAPRPRWPPAAAGGGSRCWPRCCAPGATR